MNLLIGDALLTESGGAHTRPLRQFAHLRNPVRLDGLDRVACFRNDSSARCGRRSQARNADDTADQTRQVATTADPSSTVKALARYRKQRERHLPTTIDMPFLIGSRGRRPFAARRAAGGSRLYRPARRSRLGQSRRTRCSPPARPAPHLRCPAASALVRRRRDHSEHDYSNLIHLPRLT